MSPVQTMFFNQRGCGIVKPMNVSQAWVLFASTMAGQLPVLLVYIGGIVFCAMRWRRAPSAALLAVIGTSLQLFVLITLAAAQAYMFNNRSGRGAASTVSYANIMAMMGLGGAILRAVGFALVLIAVFTQREKRETRGFEVGMVDSV